MKNRLPLAFSVAALVVAILGTTGLGSAAIDALVPVPLAKRAYLADTAKNSVRLNNIKANRTPTAGMLVPLGSNGKFPDSVGAIGPAGPAGKDGKDGAMGPGIDYTNGYRVLKSTSIPAGSTFSTLIADCKPGDVPVAGSAETQGLPIIYAGTLLFPGSVGSAAGVAGRYLLRVRNPGAAAVTVSAEVDCAPIVKATP